MTKYIHNGVNVKAAMLAFSSLGGASASEDTDNLTAEEGKELYDLWSLLADWCDAADSAEEHQVRIDEITEKTGKTFFY